jgi:Cu(I)/Ag(I) efflux system membrane fusion protein
MIQQNPLHTNPAEHPTGDTADGKPGVDTPILLEEIAQAPAPSTGWKRIRFLFKVIEIRLRFILVLAATFVVIGKWDTIKNFWEKWTRPTAADVKKLSDTEYFCPMHPSVVRDSLEPDGSVPKCPICGMPLSLHKKGEHVDLPEGIAARVQFSPQQIAMAGVQTAEVAYQPLVKEIRTVGAIDYDETRRRRIVSRAAGFVEKLYVDKTYFPVEKGEPLASIYSPDLSSTAADMTLALNRGATDLVESGKERLRRLGVGDNEIEQIVAARQLLAAINRGDNAQTEKAAGKLRELGMTDAEIDEIKSTRRAPAGIMIRSPFSGHIINKAIVQGDKVDAGMTLFDVADLSHAWVEADVFETDIPLLHAGQKVDVTVEGLPNETFHGQILLVHPHVETASRTNRIRIDLPNPDHVLRPGMYATVTVKVPFNEIEPFKTAIAKAQSGPNATDDKSLIAFQKTCPITGYKLGSMGTPVKREVKGKAVFLCCPNCVEKFEARKDAILDALAGPPQGVVLTVPEAAVIDTGAKKTVYVEHEPGVFDGIEVELGPPSGGFYPVVKGLRAGDRVAARGAFLVDAETRLNPAAGAAYVGASGGPSAVANSSSSVAPRPAKPIEKPADKPADKKPVKDPEAEIPATTNLATASAEDLKNLDQLSPADRAAAIAQQNCPITEAALGSMGVPVKVELAPGKTAYLCCKGCVPEATKEPQKTIEKLAEIEKAVKVQRR